MRQGNKYPEKSLSIGLAVLVGQLIVNVPVFLIIIGMAFFAIMFIATKYYWLSFILLPVGICLGWLWWSFMVPRWRRWAYEHGADPDKLQVWAVATGLVWPKGSLLEKTEIKLKDEE